MDLGLSGSVVAITGASQGIGLALALAFAREGANIAICARTPDRLETAAQQIRALGVQCLAIATDLTAQDACQLMIDHAAAHFDRLDVLVNNASTNVDRIPASLEDASDSQLLERFMGKTMVAIKCARAAIPHMRRGGGGRIICIGGTAARSVFRGGEQPGTGSGLPQGLGNSALVNFVKHLSEEVAADQILVNAVHPHVTRTGRHPARVAGRAARLGITLDEAEAQIAANFPIGRMVEPDDIAPMVLLLASRLSGAITGQSITIDGGALRGIYP